jgi:UDP-glucose:(heptosyl)LPS alpha-1,3-glucosyltransferase
MKLALCYESVIPARGGAETYIADLARRLAADGHAVHLFAGEWDADALPPGIQYHRLPLPRGPRWLRPWRFGASLVKALADFPELVSMGFNRTWGQDVQYPLAGLHLASVDGNHCKYANPFMRGVARLVRSFDLAHWSFRFVEHRQYVTNHPLIVTNSRMVREHFHQYYGIHPEDVRVVHSAIDPDRFAQADRPRRRLEFRQEWNLKPNDVVALFVAMNYRLKGIEPLLHAVSRLRHDDRFRLLIVGNAKTAPWQRLARRLGVESQVRFLGPRKDVHHCFFASDFLVHPTFYDPCSLVALEAMACGLPVVTTRANGAAELMTPPRDGFVVDDPHDHRRLAACIEQLLDPAVRQSCSAAARRAAAQWTFDAHYRMLLRVLEEAAARKRAA